MRAAARLLRAEFTKLRSVPRWGLTLAAAAVLTVLAGLLMAGGSRADDNETSPYPTTAEYRDEGHVATQMVGEDAELVVRVAEQDNSHPWAKAGLVLRTEDARGAAYAALVVTPEHGVRLQSDYELDIAGSQSTAPVWLRLVRSGTEVEAYESANGEDWDQVGTVTVPELGGPAQMGLLLASPDVVEVDRSFVGESISAQGTEGSARFDEITLQGANDPGQGWRERERTTQYGELTQQNGRITMVATGDVGRYDYAEDSTQGLVSGALLGVMALLGLAVVSVTAEYRTGTIRTSFAAHPRRTPVLLAKAAVIGAAAFIAGLIGAAGAVLAGTPVLAGNGLPTRDPLDPLVLQAVVGTGALTACLALLALGLAAALRRTAPALVGASVLILIPQVSVTGLPLQVGMWVERVTPAAGFAVQQTVERYDTALSPGTGLAVAAGYAALALAAGLWRTWREEP